MKITILSILFAGILITLVEGFLITDKVYSQTPTPDIKMELIENIASRVAQLRLVEKRGIIGKVTNVTNTQITVSDLQGNTRFVDVDEFTKFTSPKAKESYGISDIKDTDTLGILGLYNKDSRRILARFVTLVNPLFVVRGGIKSIDDKNFTVTVTAENGKNYLIDIDYNTITNSYTIQTDVTRSGFSKIKENYTIIASGPLDTANKNKILANRVLIFPEVPFIPKSPKQ